MAAAQTQQASKPNAGFAALWRFLPMLWPKGEGELKARVIAAMVLVLAGKADLDGVGLHPEKISAGAGGPQARGLILPRIDRPPGQDYIGPAGGAMPGATETADIETGTAAIPEAAGHPAVEPRRVGVILVNLGTPDGTGYWPMRRYLKEFLSDRRVIEVPRAIWWPILNLAILTRRPSASGAKYAAIWDRQQNASPLMVITRPTTRPWYFTLEAGPSESPEVGR